MTDAVIVAYGRSPVGRARKGSLVDVRPDDLAAHVVTKVLEKVPELEPSQIEDLICGCGLPGGEQGHNIGRVVSILARLDVPGVTVNRYCSSSLMTTRMAAHAIEAGEGDVFLSVGVECVSRYGSGYPDPPDSYNPRLVPGNAEEYPDIYIAMGQTAENVAEREKITRAEMDKYALQSQQRAVKSQDDGFFEREIIPVPLPNGQTFTKDDGPRRSTSLEALGALEPAFRPGGSVTAGNSCPLNDLGPIDASKQALKRAKMNINDIDIVEINEAFAAQVIPSARGIGVDPFSEKLNPHGGAIALGHPFGMTGARILSTLLNGLQTRDKTFGLETMCVGGGQGMAMIVERLN